MAKKKATTEAAEPASEVATATEAVPEMTDADMMRAALRDMKAEGKTAGDCKNAIVIARVKQKYNKELNKGSANAVLGKFKKEVFGEAAASTGTRTRTATTTTAATTTNNKYAGIEEDLPRLKELAEQYGADELLALAEELPALVAKFGSSFKPMLMFAAK